MFKAQMTKTRKSDSEFWYLDFEFVSDFDIRISGLNEDT
jgi:hypothetical protein